MEWHALLGSRWRLCRYQTRSKIVSKLVVAILGRPPDPLERSSKSACAANEARRLGWTAPRLLRARCFVAAANLICGRRAAAPTGQSDGRTDPPCGRPPLLGLRDFRVLLEALAQAERRPDRQGLRTVAVQPCARRPRRPRK